MAARSALSLQRCALAKQSNPSLEAARLLEVTYQSAVKQRTATVNALKQALLTLPPELKNRLVSLPTKALIETCANFKTSRGAHTQSKIALKSLAKRIQALSEEAKTLEKEIELLAKELVPNTLALSGIGIHGAIKLLSTTGQNIDRFRGEASFAKMCGVSPIPVSSGNTHRHRLNRGGSRQANSVIHIMAIARKKHCQKTKDFIVRKTTEGKSNREATRALKRYLAREVFGALKADLAALNS